MSLKKAYLYLVSTIALVIAVIGAIMIINLGLKAWVFTKADMNYYSYALRPAGRRPERQNSCLVTRPQLMPKISRPETTRHPKDKTQRRKHWL